MLAEASIADFDSAIRRFESSRPSHPIIAVLPVRLAMRRLLFL